MPSEINEVEKALQAVERVKSGLNSRLKTLCSERETVEAGLDLVRRAPLSKADAKALILGAVDSLAASFVRGHNLAGVFRAFAWPARTGSDDSFNDAQTGRAGFAPLCLTDADSATSGGYASVFGAAMNHLIFGSNAHGHPVSSSFMAFYFGDLIKAKVEMNFDHLWPEFTRKENVPESLQQRRELVAEGEATLAELTRAIEEVNGQLLQLTTRPR